LIVALIQAWIIVTGVVSKWLGRLHG